mmetsp:Transcript_37057/g.77443  ORF Transcript_37057/g.77443 Transcript_37057/m.77443 type:complete len:387 (-) Transcript_37057:246-1406(-)
MASPIMENGGFVPAFNLNMNVIHGLNAGPSIYQSLPRSPMSPVLSPMGHQVLSPVGQQFSAWPAGPSFGQMQQGHIIEEGPIQWDNGAMMVPVYQEPTQVLVPIYQEPAPKFLNRAPTLKHRSPSPPKERAAAPPSPRERAAPAPEVEERVVVKIIEVEKLVQVPVEKIVIKEVVKEVPVDREKVVIKEVYMEREPQVITKEVIRQVPVEVIKEVPVMVEKVVYRDRPERAEPPPPPPRPADPPPPREAAPPPPPRSVGAVVPLAVALPDVDLLHLVAHAHGPLAVVSEEPPVRELLLADLPVLVLVHLDHGAVKVLLAEAGVDEHRPEPGELSLADNAVGVFVDEVKGHLNSFQVLYADLRVQHFSDAREYLVLAFLFYLIGRAC